MKSEGAGVDKTRGSMRSLRLICPDDPLVEGRPFS